MDIGFNSLTNLAIIRKNVKRKRISSYDKTGANMDNVQIEAHKAYEVCNIEGAGIIKHIWMTLASPDPNYLRKGILRMWWDGEEQPSVEVPLGDFFGVGHGKTVNYWSMVLSCGPEDGKGFNCFFPMPFSSQAKIKIENEADAPLICYFYIDYEVYEVLDDKYGRFHAYWNRENPCKGKEYGKGKKIEKFMKKNTSHEDDYLILEANGEGHFVGCHLDIHNLMTPENTVKSERFWPGEGDDYMVIDDGESILYGTGTEDYFCGAWCPSQYFSSPYFGVILPGGQQWSGKITYYRYHIEDPVYFHKNLVVKIEHGHANLRSDDFSSTAYFYQKEPHKKFKPLLTVEDRLPRKEPLER
jgi:hypothetical protein